jgi:glycosyltransferase involved in cell wall biosynthesis
VVWTLHDLKSVCPTTRMLRDGKICEQCRGGRFYRALATRCKRGSLAASAVVTAELYQHRMWRVYERAQVLIAPSAFLRDKLLEHGLHPRRIEVLPNPVEADDYGGPAGDGGYVLYVGRLDPEKGVHTLVEAAVRSHVPLKVVGSGELEAGLRRDAAAAGWPGVEFLGHRQGDELRQLFRNARLVAVPSECYENCPLVVLEAFASGKPVLASRLGGLPELVEEGRTGRLLPAGDVASWSAALTELAADPLRCAAMGAEALGIARQRHSAAAHHRRLLELYDLARVERT